MTKRIMIITFRAAVTILVLGARIARAQCCGDCNGNGVVAVNELVTAVRRALAGCEDDNICSVDGCQAELAACQTDLALCQSQPGGQHFPASGQTTPYGPGSDGDVRAGAVLSYTDNGDGTITDNNTGLTWEKKDDADGIQDKDNTYTWGMIDEPYTMNGTMVTDFLATLNQAPCFAGHCDWRIPNVKELQSIVDYELSSPGPTVNAVLNSDCTAGCTVDGDGGPMCSCTAPDGYWSSTADRNDPVNAWYVFFFDGLVLKLDKSEQIPIRAVRGGL